MDYYFEHGDEILKNMLNISDDKDISDWVTDRAKKKGYRTCISSKCIDCKVDMILNNKTAFLSCPECGITVTSHTSTEYCKTHQPYKRTSRLKECLDKAQSKYIPTISSDTISIIKRYMNSSQKAYTYVDVRLSLKRLGLSKYYEDINYIIFNITGINPFKLTQQEDDIIHKYFTKILMVWPLFKPSNRRSIISYPFLIRKIIHITLQPNRCNELNLDYFSLPQLDKLIEYETLFKKIEKHHGWKTTPILF